jgi:hypothetical protein
MEEAQVISQAAERAAAATPHHGEHRARGGDREADGDVSGVEAVGTECNTGGAGYWKFVIGLVGKPSAGKSSFFNAVSDSQHPNRRNITRVEAGAYSREQQRLAAQGVLVLSGSRPPDDY